MSNGSRSQEQNVDIPVLQRTEDIVQVISQRSLSQGIEDQTRAITRCTENGRHDGADTTRTSATSLGQANEEGQAPEQNWWWWWRR